MTICAPQPSREAAPSRVSPDDHDREVGGRPPGRPCPADEHLEARAARRVPRLLVGLASGIVALVALIRYRERAIALFVAAVPLLNVVLFVLAEFLVGHD
jgi:hypothetical protein